MNKAVLAFDTSNYTTSVAACDTDGNVIADRRRLLEVKMGDRGLRQSQALFQHIKAIAELTEQAVKEVKDKGYEICAVAVSTRPRPVEGSYMPVFLAGENTGRSIAAALGVPLFVASHQEGHIAAVCGARSDSDHYLSFHMSGGTGEILRVQGFTPMEIVGGCRDISFGQLLDRTGVAAGYAFPAGAALDQLADNNADRLETGFSSRGRLTIKDGYLNPIKTDGAFVNLSGTETECLRLIETSADKALLVTELFYRISEALFRISVSACEATGLSEIVYAGGVASSSFIRSVLAKRLESKGIKATFGEPGLSSDNACGIARIGAYYLHSR